MTDPNNTYPNDSRDVGLPASTAAADAAAVRPWASAFATHGDPTLHNDSTGPASGRPGVQWVRPTDLAARAGSAVLDRGVELNTRLRDAVLEGVREGRSQLAARLASRQTQLDPETTLTTPERSIGRTGVSR